MLTIVTCFELGPYLSVGGTNTRACSCSGCTSGCTLRPNCLTYSDSLHFRIWGAFQQSWGMDKCYKFSYLEAVFDAVQPSIWFLRREIQNVLYFFGWDLFAHDLAGGYFAHFERDEGARGELARPINAR